MPMRPRPVRASSLIRRLSLKLARPTFGRGSSRGFPMVEALVVATMFAVVASLAGCSSAAATPAVSGAWVRPSMGSDQPAAAYLTIANASGQSDALLGASAPGAASVEIHQTSTGMNGMTGMAPVSRLEIPAGGTVTLAPGGTHLMIMGLATPLQVGGTLELRLVFEHAGTVVVRAEVRQG